MWGAKGLDGADGSRFESAPAAGAAGRVRDALRHLFP